MSLVSAAVDVKVSDFAKESPSSTVAH